MNYYRVKNWDKFQHYKDRNPPWIKLHQSLMDDEVFMCLSDASKLQLIMIWILVSRTENKIPGDNRYLGKKLGVDSEVDIDALVAAKFLEPYESASDLLADCMQIVRNPEQPASDMLSTHSENEISPETTQVSESSFDTDADSNEDSCVAIPLNGEKNAKNSESSAVSCDLSNRNTNVEQSASDLLADCKQLACESLSTRYVQRTENRDTEKALKAFKAKACPALSDDNDETGIDPPNDPVFLKIPCKGDSRKKQPSEYALRESTVRTWEAEEGFEDLDVRALIRRAREWCIQAPSRRKMHDNIPHWIYSIWLCKAKDKGEYPKRASPVVRVVNPPEGTLRDRFIAELDRLIGKEESQAWYSPEDSIREEPDRVVILIQSKFRMNYIEKQFFKQFESAARAAIGKDLMPVSLAIGWVEKLAV